MVSLDVLILTAGGARATQETREVMYLKNNSGATTTKWKKDSDSNPA